MDEYIVVVFKRVTRIQTQVRNIVFCLLDALAFEGIFFRDEVIQATTKRPRVRINSEGWLVRNELRRRVTDVTREV